MKKIFVIIILAFVMLGCKKNTTEDTAFVIDIKQGYKVINAAYTKMGRISVLTEKADSNYIPSEKIIIVYNTNDAGEIKGEYCYYKLIEH